MNKFVLNFVILLATFKLFYSLEIFLDEWAYVYNSNKWPQQWSQVPSLGNGHLATVVKYPWFYMAGLYNGVDSKSQRAKIPSTSRVYLEGIAPEIGGKSFSTQKLGGKNNDVGDTFANVTQSEFDFKQEFWLDTRIGTFFERHYSSRYNVTFSWYAHRSIMPIVAFRVQISDVKKLELAKRFFNFKRKPYKTKREKKLNKNHMIKKKYASYIKKLELGKIFKRNFKLKVHLNVSRNFESDDLQVEELKTSHKNAKFYRYKILSPESTDRPVYQKFYLLHDVIPNTITLNEYAPCRSWTFLTSVHFSKNIMERSYTLGKTLVKSGNKLTRKHRKRWLKLWSEGRIDINGDVQTARAVTSSLYSLLSNLPLITTRNPSKMLYNPKERKTKEPSLFIGLSPGGLSWGDREAYQGHVFWDQETWMYPPILMLHHPFSPLILHSRLRTVQAARENAIKSKNAGLRFPWESGLTGIEVSPSIECATQEIHINGDISLAFLQYFQVTDGRLSCPLKYSSSVLKLLAGLGDYWVSRVVLNSKTSKYEILCVKPPDEYADCINNSIYTNVVAKISLKLAQQIAECLQWPNATLYKRVKDNIYEPFDEKENYHPEYDGYAIGKTVKQADVILLGFPLMYNMSKEIRIRDLQIYENATAERGPAMSDAMFAINWLEMGNVEKVDTNFRKMFQHIVGDFQVWTEEKNGQGAPNFMTGMGGFLQSIIFGYFGIRIYDDKLKIEPKLPRNVTSMVLYGLDYMGNSFDIFVNGSNKVYNITWRSYNIVSMRFKVAFECKNENDRLNLKIGKSLYINCPKGYLRVNV